MIQSGAIINCADNSGAKAFRVIGIPGFARRRTATIGGIITCAIHGTTGITSNVKDHEVVKVVIVRTRKEQRRSDGTYIRFDDNAGVVVDKSKAPRGTRIFGPVARELRDLGYNKIVSFAPEVW